MQLTATRFPAIRLDVLPGKRSLGRTLAITAVAAVALTLARGDQALAAELSASASKGVAITVYNQNFGLVKDIREVELNQGINYLRFEDVAAQIDPTTVSFASLTAPNSVVVREQNYQYDLLDPNTILNKSVGKAVKFRQYLPGGSSHEISGTLLNGPTASVSDTGGNVSTHYQGLVVKTGDGVVLNPQGEVELAELPAGLVSKPSLYWKLESDKAGTHKTEIRYQTAGLNWHCDYVAVVNKDDSMTDLAGWVTLDNRSGASYKEATLKLIAGDVHKVQPRPPRPVAFMAKSMSVMGAAAPQFGEESFAEYHLYTLQNKTNVNDKETKQLSLFNASNVPVKKLFVFEPTRAGSIVPMYLPNPGNAEKKVNVKLEINNSKENQLGMPLPKGKVRVYKKDKDGALQFVGEDEIDHTPRDEKIRLYIGDAFDLVGERKQMNTQRVSAREERSSIEIDLRNHKEQAVTITCVEHAYGDWKVSNASTDFTKRDAHTFEFAVNVPADGEAKITYDITTKF